MSSNRQYTKTHEWVSLQEGVVTVGISDHAQQALGDLVFVELPEVGDEFQSGDEIAVVESVKTASDVYAPVSGKVTEINNKLDGSPETVNASPFDDGWLFKLAVSDEGELESLLSQADYDSQVKEEA